MSRVAEALRIAGEILEGNPKGCCWSDVLVAGDVSDSAVSTAIGNTFEHAAECTNTAACGSLGEHMLQLPGDDRTRVIKSLRDTGLVVGP